jgi:hypothetical protein
LKWARNQKSMNPGGRGGGGEARGGCARRLHRDTPGTLPGPLTHESGASPWSPAPGPMHPAQSCRLPVGPWSPAPGPWPQAQAPWPHLPAPSPRPPASGPRPPAPATGPRPQAPEPSSASVALDPPKFGRRSGPCFVKKFLYVSVSLEIPLCDPASPTNSFM